MANTQYICTHCGHFGRVHYKHKGNVWIEIILWMCAIVPGLIYSIWRSSSRYIYCTQCGNISLVPTSSPKGRELLKETQEKHPEVIEAQKKEEVEYAKKSKHNLIAAIVIVAIIILLNIIF